MTTKLGATLRAARTAKKLTLQQLAAQVGCTHVHISKLETGVYCNPGAVLALNLAEALDLSVADVCRLARESGGAATGGRPIDGAVN